MTGTVTKSTPGKLVLKSDETMIICGMLEESCMFQPVAYLHGTGIASPGKRML